MLILVLLGIYFYAAMIFVKTSLLLFRLALAILCAETIEGGRGKLLKLFAEIR